ncbi:MAG: class I lanthipeptide [Bacteroidales bacterium]|nr:class I lanthipeptide [Bacteroidales bacterium]
MKNKSLKSKLFLDKEEVFTLNDKLLDTIKGGNGTEIDTVLAPSDTIVFDPSDTTNDPTDTTEIT